MKTIHPAIAEHVMEENEKLRGLLGEVRVLLANSSYKISGTAAFLHSIDAALSHQDEPAPAQDERESEISHIELCITNLKDEHQTNPRVIAEVLHNIGYSRANRPAQTEQQPVAWVEVKDRHEGPYEFHGIELLDSGKHNLYAAPIAQTAPQPEQSGLVEAVTPEIIDWVRCGLSVNGRLVDGTHPALEKLCAAYRAALPSTPSPAKRGEQ